MQLTGWQNQTELSKLQAHYRATWRSFSVAVRHWQSLQVEEPQNMVRCRQAETAARAAEEQYRQARNALADSLLEQICRERETLLVGCP